MSKSQNVPKKTSGRFASFAVDPRGPVSPQASMEEPSNPETAPIIQAKAEDAGLQQASSPGRTHKTTVYTTEAAAAQLDDIQYELKKQGHRGTKINDLYCEALNLLFEKYGKNKTA